MGAGGLSENMSRAPFHNDEGLLLFLFIIVFFLNPIFLTPPTACPIYTLAHLHIFAIFGSSSSFSLEVLYLKIYFYFFMTDRGKIMIIIFLSTLKFLPYTAYPYPYLHMSMKNGQK